jgi:ribosome-associated toxin RatA of RatAB toxin-antitoxin module
VKTVRQQARVPFSADQMFDLVNDVESYPRFLPWCQKATIRFANENRVEATLEVGVRGATHRFTTRNSLERPNRIGLELIEGPFRKLSGEWRFDAPADQGCVVSLNLDFEASSVPLRLIFEILFEELIRSQVQAFVDRAESVYGHS